MSENEYPFGHPFWLWKPTKAEILSELSLSLLDLFNAGHCFLNGFRNTPCHPDSYMTVLDYAAVNKTFNIIQQEYSLSKDQWLEFCDFWENHTNKQPITCLLVMEIRRKTDEL